MKSKSTSKRRPTIGNDPLEAYVPAKRDLPDAETKADRPAVTGNGKTGRSKVRATFHISERLLQEARNAVVYLAGPPTRLTLADLAEHALRREIERLKKAHNAGKDFPARSGELRGGRPIR